VLSVVYLLFNAGYTGVENALCEEALFLADLLATTGHGDALALAALLYLQASRLPARERLLAQQDRALWNYERRDKGLRYFESSLGARFTRYHVEAAIAVEHAVAPTFAQTNWPLIVSHYSDLMRLAPSPVVELNRAIAIGFRDGPAAGLALLRELEHEPALARYPLLRDALSAFARAPGEP
jgi:RNA polymerase sigma-70 factor, ECF subfamily